MSSTVAASADAVDVELLEEFEHRVRDERAYHEAQQYEGAEAKPGASARSRIQHGLILTMCAAVQLGWLAVLGHTLFVLAQ